MTPARLGECLAVLGWPQRVLARKLNRNEGTVRQWMRGALPVPADVATVLEKLARFYERNPLPKRSA